MDHHPDTRVERAARAIEDDPGRVLRAMYEAIYAYRDTDDVEHLRRFAESARLTALARSSDDYVKASEAAPTSSMGPGRPLAEIFAGHVDR